MAFCPRCGAQLPDGATFCGNCGAQLRAQTPQPVYPQQPPVQPAPAPEAPKKKKSPLIWIILVVLIIAGCVAFNLWNKRSGGGGNPVDPALFQPDSPVFSDDFDSGSLDNPAGIEGFQSFDDMDPKELKAYLNNMLNSARADLRKEKAKGSAADQARIDELNAQIESIQQTIKDRNL